MTKSRKREPRHYPNIYVLVCKVSIYLLLAPLGVVVDGLDDLDSWPRPRQFNQSNQSRLFLLQQLNQI